MGGQGKSQVALEYCHRKKGNPYSAIFRVDATTQDRVEEAFTLLQPRYFPKYSRLHSSKWARRNISHKQHSDSCALVIKQSNHFLELFGLEESATVALLIQQSQTNEVISSDTKKNMERLGYHPLAITQAGAYIRKRKLRLCEFMDHYKRRKKIILESTPQLSQYRKLLGNAEKETSLNVFTTWELSFQQLQSEASENNVEAKLLTLLAFFDEKDISEQLVAGTDLRGC